MCKHRFLQSKKENISYCKDCGTICFNKITLLSIPSNLIRIFSIAPFFLKFKPNKYNIDVNNNYIIAYLNKRKYAINFLKIVCNIFSLSNEIFHKSLSYLDYIYLNNNIDINLIEKILLVCIYFAVEFNDCYSLNNTQNDLERFDSFIKSKDLKEIKILSLKCLNYDLGKYSILDYIDLFFSLGIIYPNKNRYINIQYIYNYCLNYLNIIIENYSSLQFSSHIIAMIIMKKTLEIHNCFDADIFKRIYGINLYKEKYYICEHNLNIIMSYHHLSQISELNNSNSIKKRIILTPKNSKQSTNENSINE
jgi:hypothetical protein